MGGRGRWYRLRSGVPYFTGGRCPAGAVPISDPGQDLTVDEVEALVSASAREVTVEQLVDPVEGFEPSGTEVLGGEEPPDGGELAAGEGGGDVGSVDDQVDGDEGIVGHDEGA